MCLGDACADEDPIVVDLSGAGFLLTNAQNGVKFDFFGTGKPLQMAWTQRNASVGFLALSRESDGLIEDGADLFGNLTSQPAGPGPVSYTHLFPTPVFVAPAAQS